jgi:hypothetical protein
MGWWKSDPDRYRYYRELDRKWQERRRELDLQLIGTSGDLDRGCREISAVQSAQRRARYRADAEQERDWLERAFRGGAFIAKQTCEKWADRASRILRTEADDAAATRRLRDDVGSAADEHRRGLRGIAAALTGEQAPADLLPRFSELLLDVGVSPLWPPLRPDRGADVREVRIQILTCAHLPEETRSDWLQCVRPGPRTIPLRPVAVPAGVVHDLRVKVAGQARYAFTESELFCSSLGLLETYVNGCNA